MKNETDQIVDAMLDHARKVYGTETVALKECLVKVTPGLESLTASMNDPQWILDKKMALSACHMLTRIGLESGGMEEGSVAHLLSLRLYDYINHGIKQE